MTERVAIIGPPRSGKTTLSAAYKRVCHADDFARLGWSEASGQLALELCSARYDCFEGVAMVRALRKWLDRHPGKPVDRVIYMRTPREPLSAGQSAMAKGVDAVWREVEPVLRRRGVVIEYR